MLSPCLLSERREKLWSWHRPATLPEWRTRAVLGEGRPGHYSLTNYLYSASHAPGLGSTADRSWCGPCPQSACGLVGARMAIKKPHDYIGRLEAPSKSQRTLRKYCQRCDPDWGSNKVIEEMGPGWDVKAKWARMGVKTGIGLRQTGSAGQGSGPEGRLVHRRGGKRPAWPVEEAGGRAGQGQAMQGPGGGSLVFISRSTGSHQAVSGAQGTVL